MKKGFKVFVAALLAVAMVMSAIPAVMAADVTQIASIEVTDPFRNAYNVISNKATGRVIAVENNGVNNLDLIVTEELVLDPAGLPYADQIWRFAPLDNGRVYVANKASGRSLDVPDAKKEEGVQLIQ